MPGMHGGINGHVAHRQTILLQSVYTDTKSIKTYVCPMRAQAIARFAAEIEAGAIRKRRRHMSHVTRTSISPIVRPLLFPPLVWCSPWASTRLSDRQHNDSWMSQDDVSAEGGSDEGAMKRHARRVLRVDSEGDTGWECQSCSFINPTLEVSCQVCIYVCVCV
jgi:hypothetical protein